MIRVIALTVALVFPADNPGAWTLSVSPQVAVPVSVGEVNEAITLPFVTFYRPFHFGYPGALAPWRDMLFDHEVQHYRQERALGPWFWLSYAATLGQPFEPDQSTGWAEWNDAWLPPPSMEASYPFVRISGSGVEFMPGYVPTHDAVYAQEGRDAFGPYALTLSSSSSEGEGGVASPPSPLPPLTARLVRASRCYPPPYDVATGRVETGDYIAVAAR